MGQPVSAAYLNLKITGKFPFSFFFVCVFVNNIKILFTLLYFTPVNSEFFSHLEAEEPKMKEEKSIIPN